MTPKLIPWYGLWSPSRKVWWADRSGVVFATVSPNIAHAQLVGVLPEERRMQRTADWIVAPIEAGDPSQE